MFTQSFTILACLEPGISIDRNLIKNFSIGVELELVRIALQSHRICIGILWVFFELQDDNDDVLLVD